MRSHFKAGGGRLEKGKRTIPIYSKKLKPLAHVTNNLTSLPFKPVICTMCPMKKLLILVSFLIYTLSTLVWAKEHFNYHAYTLSNGLQVIILPNTRAPVVYHALWYKVGSADSPAHKTGLAHFLEHMMFKGSAHFPN